jgi:hypothetical protein
MRERHTNGRRGLAVAFQRTHPPRSRAKPGLPAHRFFTILFGGFVGKGIAIP